MSRPMTTTEARVLWHLEALEQAELHVETDRGVYPPALRYTLRYGSALAPRSMLFAFAPIHSATQRGWLAPYDQDYTNARWKLRLTPAGRAALQAHQASGSTAGRPKELAH
jgi:hypothetical protein